MSNALNRPISPTLINKCIGVALLPVAGYAAWKGVVNCVGFDLSSLGAGLLFIVLPSVCFFVVAVFCVLFLVKAFRNETIKKVAITMAFFQIACVLLLVAVSAWLGGGNTTTTATTATGDTDFAFAAIYVWVLIMFYLPALLLAAVCAAAGITSLLRSPKKEQSEPVS